MMLIDGVRVMVWLPRAGVRVTDHADPVFATGGGPDRRIDTEVRGPARNQKFRDFVLLPDRPQFGFAESVTEWL